MKIKSLLVASSLMLISVSGLSAASLIEEAKSLGFASLPKDQKRCR